MTDPSPTASPSAPTALAPRPVLGRLLDAPVRFEALDAVATPLRTLIQKVEPRWLADLLHGVWLGHPLHPVLAQATVGSWTSAGLLDALLLSGVVPDDVVEGAQAASTTLVTAGLATALGTYATGWTDWSQLHEDQQRLGLVHAAGNYTATALYGVSLWQRRRGHRTSGRWWSLAATAVATGGAALGGHLAYRWAAGANHAEHVAHVAPTGWYRVAAWVDLEERKPTKGWVGDVPVVVVRLPQGVRVLADTCSHLSASLSDGEVVSVEAGGGSAPVYCLVCPWHDSSFRLDDGTVARGPATAPAPTFETRVDPHGAVLARVRELPGVPASPTTPSAVA